MPEKLTAAIIGCGKLGQHYAETYSALPNVELVALAEFNDARRAVVAKRFGVPAFKDAPEMFENIIPDVVATVLPGKYIYGAVMSAVQAGVRGISSDKPLGANLSEADEMVDACAANGVVFAGGNLQRAMYEIQEAASWISNGDFGEIIGASVNGFAGEISGGGCQAISVLRLFTNAEVTEVTAWGHPEEALKSDSDSGLAIDGRFRLSSGIECSVFSESAVRGVDVWSEDSLVRWGWDPPISVFRGFDKHGSRIQLPPTFSRYEWGEYHYLGASIRSFLEVVRSGSGQLAVSGHDLRQALEVAIASKYSALWGSVPLKLPLPDRSLQLIPSRARWLGQDPNGSGQPIDEAHIRWDGYMPEKRHVAGK